MALLSSAYPLPPHILAAGGLAGRRVLAVGGEDDPFLPPATVAAGVASYRAAGAEVTALTPPGRARRGRRGDRRAAAVAGGLS